MDAYIGYIESSIEVIQLTKLFGLHGAGEFEAKLKADESMISITVLPDLCPQIVLEDIVVFCGGCCKHTPWPAERASESVNVNLSREIAYDPAGDPAKELSS